MANFIDNATALRPTKYEPALDPASLATVVSIEYATDNGAALGTWTLLRREVPGDLPAGEQLDPANPPKPVIDYFVQTARTRAPGAVSRSTAERVEADVATALP